MANLQSKGKRRMSEKGGRQKRFVTKLTLLKSECRNNIVEGIKMKKMQTTSLNKELQKLLPIEEFEPELFRNFITYWLIRKSKSLNSATALKEIKSSNLAGWLNIIESNHKFKSLYGEETAKKLIEMLEEEIES